MEHDLESRVKAIEAQLTPDPDKISTMKASNRVKRVLDNKKIGNESQQDVIMRIVDRNEFLEARVEFLEARDESLEVENQKLKNELAKCQTVSTPVPVASQSPTPNSEMPLVSSPSANTKIVSPLKVTGKVPAGWMNEGVFPIKLMDSKNKILAQGVAKEKVAGSWQSGKAVEFVTTLIFKTATGSGTLVLQNDNPSGLPENDKIFEFPINF